MPSELTEKQAFLALNALPGIGPIGLNQLLKGFDGDPRAAGNVRAAINAGHAATRQKFIDAKTADAVTALDRSDHRR